MTDTPNPDPEPPTDHGTDESIHRGRILARLPARERRRLKGQLHDLAPPASHGDTPQRTPDAWREWTDRVVFAAEVTEENE